MFFREITSRRRNRFRLFVSVILIGLILFLCPGAARGAEVNRREDNDRGGELVYYGTADSDGSDNVDDNKTGDLRDPFGAWPSDSAAWPDALKGNQAHPEHSLFPWKYGSNNTVIVDGVTINHGTGGITQGSGKGYVLGGLWQGSPSTGYGAHSNEVYIRNSADVGKVYGGAAIGSVTGNKVHVTGGATPTKATQVTGGLSVQMNDPDVGQPSSIPYKVEGNEVYLSGESGEVAVSGTVSGGWNASGPRSGANTPDPGDNPDHGGNNDEEADAADTDVIGNGVTIERGVTVTGNIGNPANVYGGFNEGNSVTRDNWIAITGGKINPSGNLTGATDAARQIAGGYSSVIGGSNTGVYNNRVTITGGEITIKQNNDNDHKYLGIYGGRSQGGSVTVEGNSVEISGGTITIDAGKGGIPNGVITGASGGSALAGHIGTVRGNYARISGSAVITADVAGGRVNGGGTAEENWVELGGGSVTGDIYGAYDGSENSQDGVIQNNRVSLFNGAEVKKGSVYGGKADTGNSTGNSVLFYGATMKDGDVYGGASTTGDTTGNAVDLFNGSLTGDVYGGSATTGDVTGNVVNLRGMTVDGSLYGGAATTATNAKNNAVNLYGGTVKEYVYGNKDSGDWESGTWRSDGNTLNAFGGVTNVGGIDKFQEAALYGGANVNVLYTGTDAPNGSAIFNDLANDGLLSFYNDSLDQNVGRINGKYSGNGQIGLEVKFNEGTNSAEADSVVFGTAPASNVVFTFKPASGSEAAPYVNNYADSRFAETNDGSDLVYSTLESGYGIYSYIFREADSGGGKEYFVGLTAADAPDKGKVYTDGSATGLSQVALLADTFLRTGLERAVASICCPNRGFGISASAGYDTHRIGTGGDGHAYLRGFSGQLALAYNRKGTPINVGLFGEMFDGWYRTTDTVSLTNGVFGRNARGELESYGGGLFFQYRKHLAEAVEKGIAPAWIPGPHLEAVAHAGWSVMDFETVGDGAVSRFDNKGAPYYGASLGGGYVVDAFPNILADVYGHGRWVRQGGRSAVDDLGQRIELDAADSLRLVAGVRAARRTDGSVTPYAGLAAEWEVLGKPGARINGYAAKRADLSGVSGLIELGVGVRARDCVYVDLKAYGSVGRRRGIGGVLEVMYAF